MSRARCAGITVTHDGDQVVILDFASIAVYYAGTTDPIIETIYEDAVGGATLSNPFTSDADGNFEFYLDLEDEVKLIITHPDAGTLIADNVQVRAPAGTYVNLDAVQTVRTLKIGLQDGTVSAPSIYFESEPSKDTGWYKTADGRWGFTADGVKILEFRSAGMELTSGRLELTPGSVGTPAIQQISETGDNSGIYFPAEAQVGISIEGVLKALFDVTGIDLNGVIRLADGSASAPTITFRSETGLNTGFYRVSEGVIGVTIDGVQKLLISTNGVAVINGSAANPSFYFINDPDNGMYLENTNSLGLAVGGAKGAIIASDRSLFIGGDPGTIANSATGPFGYITGTAGVPSGTPANNRSSNSQYPIHFDSTNKKLYVHDGTNWKLINEPVIIVAASDATAAWKAAAGIYVCTGTADQVMVNSALTALPAGGGTVLLSEGTFSISLAGIATQKANTVIEGSGPATIIRTANGATGANGTIISLAHTACTVRNLKIDGNKANNAGNTSTFQIGVSGNYCRVENIWGINSPGFGILTNVGVNGVVVKNCIVESSTNQSFLIRSGTIAALVESCLSNGGGGITADSGPVIFSNCVSTASTAHGLAITANDVIVTGCDLFSNAGDGLLINGIRVKVIGTTSRSNTSAGFQTVSGGSFASFQSCFAYLNNSTSGGGGFDINTNDCQIVACHSVQNGEHGLRIVGHRAHVFGNRIMDNGTRTATTYSGIVVAADDCFIDGNLIRKGTAAANKHAYGITTASGSNNKIGLSNDLFDSGTLGEIGDSATNTRRESFVQVATQAGDTVANTASETNFATNKVFPALSLYSIGKLIKLSAWGEYSTLGSGTVTLQFKVKMGSTVLVDLGAVTTAISIANRRWRVQAEIAVRVVGSGAASTMMCFAEARIPTANDNVTQSRPMVAQTVSSFDLTASQTLQLSVQHGAASPSNSITMYEFNVGVEN